MFLQQNLAKIKKTLIKKSKQDFFDIIINVTYKIDYIKKIKNIQQKMLIAFASKAAHPISSSNI